MMPSSADLLPYGLGTPDLVAVGEYNVHRDVVPSLEKLSALAAERGFKLRIESAYRSFERQLSIWNRKARGELPLLSTDGVPMPVPSDASDITVYALSAVTARLAVY